MAGRDAPAQSAIGQTLYARAAFFDTAAFVALANRREGPRHRDAVECLALIQVHRLPVLTSLPIVYETHRRMLTDPDLGPVAAARFLEEIYDGSIPIVRTVDADEVEARRLIRMYPDLTLTDASSMAVMARLGIAVCFSFDRHFLQAGFIRIPPFHIG